MPWPPRPRLQNNQPDTIFIRRNKYVQWYYSYANYDLAAVETDYEKVSDELSRAQLALDAVNQRDTFELEE